MTGIEEVAGSLGVGVSTSVSVEQDPVSGSGPTTHDKPSETDGKAAQDDVDDDMYATAEGEDAEERGGDRIPEENAGGGEYAGEGPTDSNTNSPRRRKRSHPRDDKGDGEVSAYRPNEDPAATPMVVVQPETTRDQQDHDILMAIDPALETLPGSQPPPSQDAAPRSDDTESQLPT